MIATEWKRFVPWLWLAAAAVPTAYVVVLAAVFAASLRSGGVVLHAFLVAATVAPLVMWGIGYRVAASGWERRVCRSLFATALSAPVAVLSLFVVSFLALGPGV